MSDKAEQPTITQADRDAAARFARTAWHLFWPNDYDRAIADADEIATGRNDNWHLVQAFARHRTTSLAAQEVDSGMSSDAVERAEWFWTNLPTGRKWTGLATYEKALVCHQIARITPSLPAQDGLVEALELAFDFAVKVNALLTPLKSEWQDANAWSEYDEGVFQMRPKVTVALQAALSAIKEQHHD